MNYFLYIDNKGGNFFQFSWKTNKSGRTCLYRERRSKEHRREMQGRKLYDEQVKRMVKNKQQNITSDNGKYYPIIFPKQTLLGTALTNKQKCKKKTKKENLFPTFLLTLFSFFFIFVLFLLLLRCLLFVMITTLCTICRNYFE